LGDYPGRAGGGGTGLLDASGKPLVVAGGGGGGGQSGVSGTLGGGVD